MIFSKFTYHSKYFMLPSVFVKATSRVHQCFFLFPFAGPKLQRSAAGEKPGLLTHGEVSCLLASMSKHTQEWLDWNTQAINLHCLQTLARHSLIFEQEKLQAHSLNPLCCLITAAHCMCYQCFSPSHFSFLQVKLEIGVMKYLETNYWGLPFLSSASPREVVQVGVGWPWCNSW